MCWSSLKCRFIKVPQVCFILPCIGCRGWRAKFLQMDLAMWPDTASPPDLDLGLALGISSPAQWGVRCKSTNQCLLQRSQRGAAELPLTWHSPRTRRVTKPTLSDSRQFSQWVMVRLYRSKARGLPEVEADHSLRGTREAPRPGGNGARMNSLIFPSPLDPLQTTTKWNLSGVGKWAPQW